jgi:hypothetical protein
MVRECWIMAFGMAEVMTGFLVMIGMFSRVWCLMMVYLFAKLMLVNFGWDEIPHLYPIAAFLVVLSSNNLDNAFAIVDRRAEAVTRTGKNMVQHIVLSFVLAACLATLAVFPMLAFLTHTHPKPVPSFPVTATWSAGTQGDGQIVLTIPKIPSVAGEATSNHFRLKAQVKRGNSLDTVTWVDKDFPKVEASEGTTPPIVTQEAPLVTSDNPRTITVSVPAQPASGPASLNSLILTLTRVEDQKLASPRSINVTLPTEP